MRSSSGQYFIALDQIRALALFIVFTWHFLHNTHGFPVLFNQSPAFFPLALLDEGHTGVALFMTLSGYLFAKLLDNKVIDYKAFFWNRCIRLIPLLAIIIIIVGIGKYLNGQDLYLYVASIAKGFIFPTLPNGGWSIATEFHFYVILPLFLWMFRKSKFLPILIIVMALLFRFFLFLIYGEVQSFAYWTIIGRVDQFVLGMLLFQFRHKLVRQNLFVALVLILFFIYYWWFDFQGGFYHNFLIRRRIHYGYLCQQ